MSDLIEAAGDIDCRRVEQAHGEQSRQVRLDQGDGTGAVVKNLRDLKRAFQSAFERKQLESGEVWAEKSCKMVQRMTSAPTTTGK